jgi:DNA-binding CsgD family transcriptional regulator
LEVPASSSTSRPSNVKHGKFIVLAFSGHHAQTAGSERTGEQSLGRVALRVEGIRMEQIDRLTSRQRDCLRLVMQHCPSKEIARALAISPNTVDQHIRAAMTILGAPNRVSAARLLAAHEVETHPQPLTSPSSGIAEHRPVQHSDATFGDQETRTKAMSGSGNSVKGFFEEQVESRVRDYQANYSASYPQMAPSTFRSVIPWDGRRQNDLTTVQRLGWIAIIMIGTTLAFGALLAGLDALSRLT